MNLQRVEEDNRSEHEEDHRRNGNQEHLHVVLRKIANAFRNATIGVAAAARPTAKETNLVREVSKHLVHQMLKRCERVTTAKRHNQKLI
ncbi:3059_t:CDS:2, partial [Gigaspora rosea]